MKPKSLEVKEVLKGILIKKENNWNSKEREKFTMNKLLNLPWLKNGQYLRKDNNFLKTLKSCYLGYKHDVINTTNMEDKYYVIHEPFGSRYSPDYLFITPKGIFGVEDKSSKNGKISWNTGTPGQNKIITYFDKKKKNVYLLTSHDYGWTIQIEERYKKFKKKILDFAKEEFKKEFSENVEKPIELLNYYARPMLTDNNLISELYNKSEINVDNILREYLDNDIIWQEVENHNTDNTTQEEMSVNSQ